MENERLLQVQNLEVVYKTGDGVVRAVNGIGFELNTKETLGIVGETGAGKSTTALSIMRLLPERTGKIINGSIVFAGQELLKLKPADMRAIRGRQIAMIFQDPMTSLNPVLTVGDQIRESIELHNAFSREELNRRVDEMLELVGIPPARKNEYPHQFSGGMKQRVVIAMALSCNPQLVIADEPTTALDVTIQAQVLRMMSALKEKLDTSMILITHDLGVVAKTCDKVAIMYAGEIIESGTVRDIFLGENHHPYTVGLFRSLPDMNGEAERLSPIDGLMPDPTDLPAGCKFHPRCPRCMEICKSKEPAAFTSGTQSIKCHLFGEA